MREMTKHKPKFNVGDKVRHIWGNEVCPVTGVTNKGYQIKGEGPVPFDDEVLWELVEQPKFNLGDIIVCKDDGLYGIRYIITEIKQDHYVAMPHHYEIEPKEDKIIPFGDQNKWEYPLEATETECKTSKSKLKLGVDLNEELRIDTLWKDTLASMVTDITKRNADSFVWLIDETLKFMDCGAYDEMACNGMRLFAKELKKRLGYES